MENRKYTINIADGRTTKIWELKASIDILPQVNAGAPRYFTKSNTKIKFEDNKSIQEMLAHPDWCKIPQKIAEVFRKKYLLGKTHLCKKFVIRGVTYRYSIS